MKVLIACEFPGIVRDAFIAKGHDAISCDLLPTEKPGPHYQGNVFDIISNGFDMMIFFWPCTNLASSGARWFYYKKDLQDKDIIAFKRLMNCNIPKIGGENPIGILSTKYRKPDQIIQPYQFGHPETKATCLWLKGLPLLIPTNIVEPDFMRKPNGEYYKDKKGKRYSRIHFMSRNNPNRAKDRSRTYQGIADAMAEQWG
jgi:hypothetical protein